MASNLTFCNNPSEVVPWESVLEDDRYNTKHPELMGIAVALSFQSSPPPSYKHLHWLHLHPDLINHAKPVLSGPQIEGAQFILTASQKPLRDGFQPGIFIGDQTGAGKTRFVLLAMVEASHRKENFRGLYITANKNLCTNAMKELKLLKSNLECFHYPENLTLDKRKLISEVKSSYIIFTTYSTLSNKLDHQNLFNIYNRLNENCWIVMDESHFCRNNTTNCSKAVTWLQRKLPQAMVVYVTATVGSEPKHMEHMSRLGLWGTNAPFQNLQKFLSGKRKRGIVGMELIANFLKSEGSYISRQLVIENVRYERHERELKIFEQNIYDKSTILWQSLLKCITLNGKHDPLEIRQYWSSHQRYFKSLILAFKAPAVKKLTERYPLDEYAFVIAIQTTGQEAYKREMTGKTQMKKFSTCREILLRTLHFFKARWSKPTYKRSPVVEPYLSKVYEILEYLQDRLPQCAIDKVVEDFGGHEHIAEITGRKCMPKKVNAFPGLKKNQNVVTKQDFAEKTPFLSSVSIDLRDIETDFQCYSDEEDAVIEDEEDVYENCAIFLDVQKEVEAFQNGQKPAIIISQRGATGISLHADKSRKKHLPRIHVVLEFPWVPEHAIQQLGRTSRSNQSSSPIYILMWIDIPGELRFYQTLVQRLNKMGALCDGDRGGSTQLTKSLDNPFIDYPDVADEAANEVIKGIKISESPTVLAFKKTILPAVQLLDSSDKTEKVNMQKFLNRILGVNISSQKELIKLLNDAYKNLVAAKLEEGVLETGMRELTDSWILTKVNEDVYGADTQVGCSLLTLEVDKGIHFSQLEKSLESMTEEKRNKIVFFLQNDIVACCLINKVSPPLDEGGQEQVQSYNVYTPWNNNFVEQQASLFFKFKKIEYVKYLDPEQKRIIESKWQTLFEQGEQKGTCLHTRGMVNKQCKDPVDCLRKPFGPRKFELTVLTGCLLFTWDHVIAILKEKGKKGMKVGQMLRFRIATGDGFQKIIGLEVPESAQFSLKQKLSSLYDLKSSKSELKEDPDHIEPYCAIEEQFQMRRSLKIIVRDDKVASKSENKRKVEGELDQLPIPKVFCREDKIKKSSKNTKTFGAQASEVPLVSQREEIYSSQLDHLKIKLFKEKSHESSVVDTKVDRQPIKYASVSSPSFTAEQSVTTSPTNSYISCKLGDVDLADDLLLSESDGSDADDES